MSGLHVEARLHFLGYRDILIWYVITVDNNPGYTSIYRYVITVDDIPGHTSTHRHVITVDDIMVTDTCTHYHIHTNKVQARRKIK